MTSDRYTTLPGRTVLALSGEDVRPFLQGLITNDIEQVSPDRAIYAALLTPQGKFLHDFFIAECGGRLLVDCAAARIDDLIKRLTIYRMRAKVMITDESDSWAVHALLPADSANGAAGDAGDWLGGIAFTDPRHAALGRRTIVPTGAILEAGLTEAAANEYEALRISLGIPADGQELIADKSMPLETGFDELHGVAFDKGCFIGQEVTTRMKHRNLVKKRLFPVRLNGDAEPGSAVKCGDVDAGEIRSVLDGRGIALLRLDLVEKGGLTVNGVAVTPEKPDWAEF